MSYPYSSTQLKTMIEHCPKAMDYAEKHGDDKLIYDAGVVAHSIIEKVLKTKATSQEEIQAISDEVAIDMMSSGYIYNNAQQPPRNPNKVFEGVNIALDYLFSINLEEYKEGSHPEIKLGMTSELKPCAYDAPDCVFRATIDLISKREIDDEEFYAKGVIATDWKTSWQANKTELHTLQRKGQAVLAWLHYPEAHFITQQIVNLRSHATYENQIMLDLQGIETLTQWGEQILLTCKAADMPRVARPGAGCLTCPYVINICQEANVINENSELAILLTVAKAKYDALLELAKKTITTNQTIDKGEVGWHLRSGSKPIENAHHLLLGEWLNDDISSLFAALKLGVGNYRNVAKIMFADKDERKMFLDKILQEDPSQYFGIKKIKGV